MRCLHRALTWLAVTSWIGVVLPSLGSVARAETTTRSVDDASAEERAVAADLFQQAAKARENEEWSSCESYLEEAIAIVETPGLRFHLAYCKEQQQRWVEALVDYRRAGEMIAGGAEAPDVEELLPSAIARLEKEIPRLTLVGKAPPNGTKLYFDGEVRSIKLFGKPVPLDPGNRRVEIVAEGYEVFSHQVTMLPAERRELQVVLREKDDGAAAPADEPERDSAVSRQAEQRDEPLLSAKGYVMLAEALVTAAGVGVGIGFDIQADAHEQDRQTITSVIGDESGCAGPTPHQSCDQLRQASADADTARNLSTAAFITGGVGAAALVATYLIWPNADEGNQENASRAEREVSISVSPSNEGISAMLVGRF